jgi:ubiquinone/menaquinone biosynthesis C-methylase UbiE
MKSVKDLFSERSDQYAQYRPGYPEKLFHFLASLSKNQARALDCATGNGQVAVGLSKYFHDVYAIDISSEQLRYANREPNIIYSVQRAEKTAFPSGYFDLITVAQALHWFDLSSFYVEASRCLTKDGVLAIWAYSTFSSTNPEIDKYIDELYNGRLMGYWDEARNMVENGYADISPKGFQELSASSEFTMYVHWNLHQLYGYLSTWSAVKKYIRHTGKDPVKKLMDQMESSEFTSPLTFHFPIHLRIFKNSQ